MGDELKYKFSYADTFQKVKRLVKDCQETGYCCHDFETNGDHFCEPTSFITIMAISFQPGYSYVVPLGHKDSRLKSIWISVLKYIGRELIENPNVIKICQNFKFEYNWWRKYGITMRGMVFDTMLQKYILDEERPHGLKPLVDKFIPKYAGYDLKGSPSSKAPRSRIIDFWSNVPLPELSKYCALDADCTFQLWIFFETRVVEGGFIPIYRNMLLMASRVLADAEFTGMYTDREYLEDLVDVYAEKISDQDEKLRSYEEVREFEKHRIAAIKEAMIAEVEDEIDELEAQDGKERMIANREAKLSRMLAGEFTTKKEKEKLEPLNFGSPNQMISLLHGNDYGFQWRIAKFTTDKKTKKPTNRPSTDEEALKILKSEYEHPFIDDLLNMRAITKMNSTYVLGMLERLHSNDRIHGSFLVHGTVTGRLSSVNPNLQNIPRTHTNNDIKPMFIAVDGKLILHLDYSQAELRVMAYLAGEETMLHWFMTGRDIHLSTACKKYEADYDEIKKILDDDNHPENDLWTIRRKQAKTTNFGIAYEQGPQKLADKLTEQGIPTTKEEAAAILDAWFRDFPKIKRFINNQHKIAEHQGYVNTLFGRKRRLATNLSSDKKGVVAEALRQSVNSVVQGSASDFALFSSVLIREAIMDGRLPASMEQFGTVHDSLLYYINPEDIHEAVPILAEICRNPETMEWFNFEVKGVEMKVDFDIGSSWGNIKGYKKDADYVKSYEEFKESGEWKVVMQDQEGITS